MKLQGCTWVGIDTNVAQRRLARSPCFAFISCFISSTEFPNTGGTYLGELLASAWRSTIRLFAEGAPFESKDTLRARGYRWFEGNGDRPKSWRMDLYEKELTAELEFPKAYIFGGKYVQLPTERFSAMNRYSVRNPKGSPNNSKRADTQMGWCPHLLAIEENYHCTA